MLGRREGPGLRGPYAVLAALLALWALVWGAGNHVSSARGSSDARTSGAVPPQETYVQVLRVQPFLMPVLLQALALPGESGTYDLGVLGRDYEARQVRLHVLRWRGDGFEPVWTSENLFEWASHVAAAAGDFRGSGEAEIVVATDGSLLLYARSGDGFQLVARAPNPLGDVWEVVAWRRAPGERHLLGLTRVREMDGGSPRKEIVWFRWEGSRWLRHWRPLRVGNLRSVTAGDITGDGTDELIVERGRATEPGIVEVWRYDSPGEGAAEGARGLGPLGSMRLASAQPLRPAAVFALGAGRPAGAGRDWIVIGDDRGRVALYEADGTGLRLRGEPVPVGWMLADAAFADFTGEGRGDIVVLGYPNRLHVLQPVAPGTTGRR